MAVIKAAFGICSLSEEKLLDRLEKLYIVAFKAGLNQKITNTTLYHKVNAMMAIMGADGQVCTKQQCALEVMDALHNIDDGTYQVAQPPAQAEPKLEKPATVGAFTFNAGVSERLVIEAAQRQYEYSQQPEQIEARQQRLRGFIEELHQAEPSHDTEQQRRDALEWYAMEAEAIASNFSKGKDKAVLASVQVLALDGGKRARNAQAAIEAEGKA